MEATPWRPEGEYVSLAERRVRALVRASLQSIALINQADWAFGQYVPPAGPLGESSERGEEAVLGSLGWRMIENLDWQKRAAATFVFSGVARVLEKRVDFTGECVRDCSTGAFLEFSMITVGLRA